MVDPSTGFVFTGDVNSTRMNVVAATDPKVRVVVNTGSGFGEVSGIVPLGIDPPPGVVSGPEGSLAAFQVEVKLPASMPPLQRRAHQFWRVASSAITAARVTSRKKKLARRSPWLKGSSAPPAG